jgi:hypothetical protein
MPLIMLELAGSGAGVRKKVIPSMLSPSIATRKQEDNWGRGVPGMG